MHNRQPVGIRIKRTVSVTTKSIKDFMELAIETSEHSHKVMGIEPEVFLKRGHKSHNTEFVIHTDFPSMAAYEDVFLYGLLFDPRYLQLAAKGVAMITDEPLDELYVRLQPDDFFLSQSKKRVHYKFESAKVATTSSTSKPRYRIEREYCAAKGRLADVMEMNFGYMDHLFQKQGDAPKYFCTRFSAERIGCSAMYVDMGDPPPFDAFMAQDHRIAQHHAGMLLQPPIETMLVRVDQSAVNALS